ncbi:hypothetical protein BVY03_04635 [bacterium K02(2017)]|nr:hypothetical protein BVY03_04635 [bacterium K02(2017)]
MMASVITKSSLTLLLVILLTNFIACGGVNQPQQIDVLESLSCVDFDDCDGDGVPALCDLDDDDELMMLEADNCDVCLDADDEEFEELGCGLDQNQKSFLPNIGINADPNGSTKTPTGSVVGDGDVEIKKIF